MNSLDNAMYFMQIQTLEGKVLKRIIKK